MGDRCTTCGRELGARVHDLASYRGDRCDSAWRPDPDCARLGEAFAAGKLAGFIDATRIAIAAANALPFPQRYEANKVIRALLAETSNG